MEGVGAMSASLYLVKPTNSGVYCFRVRVPKDIQGIAGRSELRYSVHTSDPVLARCRSMVLGRNLRQLLVLLRKKRESNNRPETELKTMFTDLLQKCLQKWLAEAEEDRAMRSRPLTEDELEDTLEALSFLETDARETLALCDYSRISRYVDELLIEHEISGVTKDSPTYRTLCRELLRTHIRYMETEQRRAVGDYRTELSKPSSPVAGATSIAVTEVQAAHGGQTTTSVRTDSSQNATPQGGSGPASESPLLSEVIKRYSEEQKRGNRWTAKTEGETKASLNLLVQIVGDVPIRTLVNLDGSAALREFKNKLMSLPPNYRKSPKYRDKAIAQLLQMFEAGKIPKTLSVTTINKHLTRATSLFKWAVQNGYMDRNPSEGLQIATTIRDDEQRAVFTDDDLKKLFHSKDYLKDSHKHGYRFWLPVLALFTGARLTELCQLYTDDIREVEPQSIAKPPCGGKDATQGVSRSDSSRSPLRDAPVGRGTTSADRLYVIDINETGDKKLKTRKSSRRIVPLHDFIVKDLDFIGYVEKLKAQGQTRLFPELKRRKEGYGKTASKWFGEYRQKCGFKLHRKSDDERKDFHSFRHTVANILKQTGVDESVVRELLGQSSNSITFGRYGKRYTPQVLKEQAVDRLDYGVSLNHLKLASLRCGECCF
jgi:integrase